MRRLKWAATWRGKGTEDMSGVEPGMRVGVYGNRTVGTFSVVSIGPRGGRGKVVGYGRGPIFLDDAQFVVEASGRERVRREKKRYVHAYVVGTFSTDQGSGIETPAPAYYNPFATDEWVRFDDQDQTLKSAPRVMLAFAGDGRPRVVYEDAKTGKTEEVEMETGMPPPEQVEEEEEGPDPVLFDETVEDPYEHPEDFLGMPRGGHRRFSFWQEYVAAQAEAKVKKYGNRLQLIIEGRLPREDGRVSTVETHRVGDVYQRPGVGYFVSVYPHFAAAFPGLAGALQTIASRPKARFAAEATAVTQDYVLDQARSLDEGTPTPTPQEDLNMPNPNRLAQLGEMPFIQDEPPEAHEGERSDDEGAREDALVDSILACLDECGVDTGGIDHEELEKKIMEHAKAIIDDVMDLRSADEGEDDGEDDGEDEHPESIMDRAGSTRRVRFVREGQIAEGIIIDVTPDGTHVDVQLDQDGTDVETVPVGDLMPMEVIEVEMGEEPFGDIADVAEPAD